MGKGTRQEDKERFSKANMNLKAQVFGATILPKVGSAAMEPRASPKSARAWRKDAAVFSASFPLGSLLETHQCNYPRAWRF